MQRGERHFGGGGEPEVVVGAAEAFFGEFGQLAGSGEAGAVHQDRRHHLGVALGAVQIEHEADQGALQPGAIPHQGDETALGNAHRALGFKQTEAISQLPVLFEVFALARFAPTLHLNVVGLAFAIGGIG